MTTRVEEGVSVETQGRPARHSPASLLLRHAWKLGFGLLAAGLLTARGAAQLPDSVSSHPVAATGPNGPTIVACGSLGTGVTTWNAAGSPYILPYNTTNDPVNPSACPAFPLPNEPDPPATPGVIVPSGGTLVVDVSQGPVDIFSYGAGIAVDGGRLRTIGPASLINSVRFDAQPQVASWDGIRITGNGTGDASLAYVGIQHALTAITIKSHAVVTPNPDPNASSSATVPYGLAIFNSSIGPSYFDGVEATDTPVSLVGDGTLGTINNIGAIGLEASFGAQAPRPQEKALKVDGMTFGSSAPFAENGCLPGQPCYIGNQAILGTFVPNTQQPVAITGSKFFRAGANGVQLDGATAPVITANTFGCDGLGAPQAGPGCAGKGPWYAAINLNQVTVDMTRDVTDNKGYGSGLDAIVFNGTVTSQSFTWQNSANATGAPPSPLGYLLNGDLSMNGGDFIVPGGSIVRTLGAINLNGSSLKAGDGNAKVFTSLRDPNIGDAIGSSICHSVFVQSCPKVLAGGEWGGINLLGSLANANLNKASILYATTGVQIANGAATVSEKPLDTTFGTNYGLVITNSHLGPNFADGVSVQNTPTAVVDSFIDCPAGVCPLTTPIHGAAAGNHGILADLTGNGTGQKLGDGLLIRNTLSQGSINEGIRAIGLAGQTVAVNKNTINAAGPKDTAGAAGIYLRGSDNLTLQGNTVSASGTGSPAYPAIWLDGVKNADFNAAISGNGGSGNGLDSLAFHGTTATGLSWIPPANLPLTTVTPAPALGYLLDDTLTVNGNLLIGATAYVPVLRGSIIVQRGKLDAQSAAVVTSLREKVNNFPTCGSVFVPAVSGSCPLFPPPANYWGGFSLDPDYVSTVTGSGIRYAASGLVVRPPGGAPSLVNLAVSGATIRNISGDGIQTSSPLLVEGGSFSSIGQNAIEQTLTNVPSGTSALRVRSSSLRQTSFNGIGLAAITSTGLSGASAEVTNTSITAAGTYGIVLQSADTVVSGGSVTVTGNQITGSGKAPVGSKLTYPAIYLNGFAGTAANIANNTGSGNGFNALAFHGTLTSDLIWATARQTNTGGLGYVLNGDLDMQANQLTVGAGDIVKSSGKIKFAGGTLKANDTGSASQKILTSLSDDSAGVPACGSALLVGCSAASPGDWGGLVFSDGASGNLVNSAIRNATTGMSIVNAAPSSSDSSMFGVTLSRSTIGPSKSDGINSTGTALSVTDSSFINQPAGLNTTPGLRGIVVDLTRAGPAPTTPLALRLSGNRFANTQAEALLGQGLATHPVWITDNQVQGAGTFGMRLLNADELVLRNNNVSGSGGGYPAIYLSNVNGEFIHNIRGNVGRGNGLNAIVMDGTVTGDLNWITRTLTDAATTKPLGYLLDGGLTLEGGNLNLKGGDVVKAAGSIRLKGGMLNAADGGRKVFTSLKDDDPTSGGGVLSCPSFLGPCGAAKGNWGGIVLTDRGTAKGSGLLANTLINYADTGIAIDSGPMGVSGESSDYRLEVTGGSKISNASNDGINSLDTPFRVDSSSITNVDGHGIIASFFSPANCLSSPNPSTCLRMNLNKVSITGAGKDGIIANGLAGQPVSLTDNTVTNALTYGIRLVGADQSAAVSGNTVTGSGAPLSSLRYPAIYLSGVTADFNGTGSITKNYGLNNGIDAVVFHGTANNGLTWITPGSIAPTLAHPNPPLGYMLDGSLTVNGNLSTSGVVKVLTGTIKVNGSLNSIGTVFTSMQDAVAPVSCSSVFVPPVPATAFPSCPGTPSAWGGINVDATTSNFTGGAIRWASTGLIITGAPLNVTGGTHLSHLSGDAITVNNAGGLSTFNDLTVDTVAGNGVKLVNSDAGFARDVFTGVTGTGNFAINSTGGTTAITCSSIHDNANGVSFDGASTIADSWDYSNGTANVVGTQGSPTATAVWWGTPNMAVNASGVSVHELLPGKSPVVTRVEFTGSNPTGTDTPTVRALSSGPSGGGTVTETVTFDLGMDGSVSPDLSFTSGQLGDPGHDITSTAGGSWDSRHRAYTSGNYTLSQGTATAGLNHGSVTGAQSCIPDVGRAMATTPTTDVNLAVLPSTVAVIAPPSATYGGTTTLSATLTSVLSPIVNETESPVAFTILDAGNNALATGSHGTDGSGVATTGPISLVGLNGSTTYKVSAVFAGDNSHAPSLPDANQTLLINPVGTTTSSAASATAVSAATNVTDQATIRTGVPSTATGSVTYRLYSDPACSTLVTTFGPLTIATPGVLPSSGTWVAGPASGTAYQWQATYSGDGNHVTSTSACGSDPVLVGVSTPTLVSTPSSNGTVGDTITDSATLSGGASPTGSISFALYAPGDTSCTTDLVGANLSFKNLSLPTATTPTYVTTQAGTYHWVASYPGDLSNAAVSGGCGAEPVTLAKASPSLATVASGGVAVGGTITDTANLTGGYNPSGSISFALFAPGDATCSTDLLTASPTFHNIGLTAGSASTPTYTTTQAGTYHWEATYNGDANNTATSPTACASEPVVITKAKPSVSTVPSATGVVGTAISDSASVLGGYGPTGTVSFALFGPGDTLCATDLLASSPTFKNLSIGAASTPGYATTAAGTYRWIATYNGDGNNSTASTACQDEQVVVSKATPTFGTVASSGATVGANITDTGNVTDGFSPTGSLSFGLFAPGDTMCTTDLLSGASAFHNIGLTSGSATTPMYATTHAGTYHWIATYNGDGNNNAVSSKCGDESVTMAQATPSIGTAVSPASPVITGTPVKDQATLLSTTPDAGGTVTYALYAGTVCTGTPAFTVAEPVLMGNPGQSAAYAVAPAGTYTWQASYTGDANNLGATSTCGGDPLVVNSVLPAVSNLSLSKGPAAGGTTVTITGTHLAFATSVNFGTTAGTIVSVSDTQIMVKSPAVPAAIVDILVTTPSGTSAANPPADQFTFTAYSATILADSPAIYWRLGEAMATTPAADASGNGHSGTYSASGVTAGQSGALKGDSDNAVVLDGIGGSVQEASGAGTPVGSAVRSVEVWFKTTASGTQTLFNYGSPGARSQFSVQLAGSALQVNDGSETLSVSALSTLADGNWHHLVVTYDGATAITFYVDGAQLGLSQTTSGLLATASTGLEVGTANASAFFNGGIDEAALYPSVLSGTQVAAHYHAGHGDS